jgi:hypothetical protein
MKNEEEIQSSHSHRYYPLPFLLALFGYSLILMIEKVIFDSHTHALDEEEEEVIEADKNIINVNININMQNSQYFDTQFRGGSSSLCNYG